MTHSKYPLCHIDPAAQIADDVRIEPFTTIQGDVIIESGTWIGSNVVIHNGARIGKNCQIFPGAVISIVPQDMKFNQEYSTVEIGNNVVIREYVTLHRGTTYNYKTLVEENVLIMAYTHIAHDCIIRKNAIIANSVNLAGHVIVDEFAVIGGACGVHQFCHIGKHSMIAFMVPVRKDVPPFTLAGRNPLSYIGVNHRGLSRRGFTQDNIREIQEIYRTIYLSNYSYSQGLEVVEATFPQSAIRSDIVDFIRGSKRGIMRGYNFMKNKNIGSDDAGIGE